MLDICRNQHRRIILGVLLAEQRSVTLDDLTQTVLEYNHHIPRTEAADELVAEIRIALHHKHIPKLASDGLISYEPDRDRVAATDQLEGVQPIVAGILDADPELEAPIELEDRSRSLWYCGRSGGRE
jgi:hypothetical protein